MAGISSREGGRVRDLLVLFMTAGVSHACLAGDVRSWRPEDVHVPNVCEAGFRGYKAVIVLSGDTVRYVNFIYDSPVSQIIP